MDSKELFKKNRLSIFIIIYIIILDMNIGFTLNELRKTPKTWGVFYYFSVFICINYSVELFFSFSNSSKSISYRFSKYVSNSCKARPMHK